MSETPTFAAGYRSERADWGRFLQCWRDQVQQRLAAGRGYAGLQALPPDVNAIAPGEPNEALVSAITEHESRLGFRLPKSYRHFVEATADRGWFIEASTDLENQPTLLPLARIGPYPARDPETFAHWKNADSSREAIDMHRYLRYGYHPDPLQRQNPVYFSASQLEKLILVGIFDGGGTVLLNPAVVSSDGEFEAWVLDFKTFATRYRSFAEMMQNEAYVDIALDQAKSPQVEPGALKLSPCTALLQTAGN